MSTELTPATLRTWLVQHDLGTTFEYQSCEECLLASFLGASRVIEKFYWLTDTSRPSRLPGWADDAARLGVPSNCIHRGDLTSYGEVLAYLDASYPAVVPA